MANSFSLEIVMGWSPFRIILVIFVPVILSLAIGLWFQARDPTDLATIQTAWGIASYYFLLLVAVGYSILSS